MTNLPAAATTTTARASWRRPAEIAVFLLYVVALGAGMSTHVMWRDEWSAWLIVRDSDGLAELFRNLRYEGHPSLYYLLLYGAKPFASGALALHAVQAALACASVAMLLWASPFTLVERALLPFGTYTLYEYGIKSRGYVLGMLLLWLLCALWRRRRSPVAIGLTLALLANVHILFAILACAAFAAIVGRELLLRVRDHGKPRPPLWQDALGALLFGAGLVAALATAWPAPDAAFVRAMTPYGPERALGGLFAVGAFAGGVHPLFVLPGLLILLAALASLRRDAEALAFFALSAFGLLLFFQAVYYPNIQHGGALFAALIAAAWLARPPLATWTGTALLGPRLLFPVLIAQAAIGLTLYRKEFSQPYSNSRAVADYIRAHGWEGQEIAALADDKAVPVLGYLDAASFYFVPGHRRGSFVRWDRARFGPHDTLLPGDLPDTCPLTLIADADLPDADASAFRLTRVAAFAGAQGDENYVLYRRECR